MSVSVIKKSVDYLGSDNKDILGVEHNKMKDHENHQELKIDLNKLQTLINGYSKKEELSRKLGLPYGLPIDTFSEIESPLTVKMNTSLGQRITELRSRKNKKSVAKSVKKTAKVVAKTAVQVVDKAETVMESANEMVNITEEAIVNVAESTGSILGGIISEPINAAKEKIHEVVEFANHTKEFTENMVHEAANLASRGANFILHIPGLASEALGNKVARAYEKAGRKLGGRVEPFTNTMANVSRAIGHTVHNFSDNISSMVGDIMFHPEKETEK